MASESSQSHQPIVFETGWIEHSPSTQQPYNGPHWPGTTASSASGIAYLFGWSRNLSIASVA